MTVKDLITKLQTSCNPDDIVVVSSDAEGNSYHEVGDLTFDTFTPTQFGAGDVLLRTLTAKLIREGYTQKDDVGDPVNGAVNCVTIWPTN